MTWADLLNVHLQANAALPTLLLHKQMPRKAKQVCWVPHCLHDDLLSRNAQYCQIPSWLTRDGTFRTQFPLKLVTGRDP